MALVLKDRVRESTITSGTGTLTLDGAIIGFQSFSVIGDSNTTYYAIVDVSTGAWEVGVGTYTAAGPTLSRDSVLESSNSGNLVNFTDNIKDVFCTYPAEQAVTLTDVQTLTNKTLTSPAINTATITGGTVSTATLSNNTISGGTINNTTIGASSATTGTFTTLTATADSAFTSTGALVISKGTTAERPGAPAASMLRFNTSTAEFEGYNGTVWASVGGAAIVNDTSTASNLYPLFANATTGTAATVFTGDAKLLYKPSTGELQSTALVASNGIVVNSATVTETYTIPTGSNAMSAGPVTVNDGIAVTVPSGSVWTVI